MTPAAVVSPMNHADGLTPIIATAVGNPTRTGRIHHLDQPTNTPA